MGAACSFRSVKSFSGVAVWGGPDARIFVHTPLWPQFNRFMPLLAGGVAATPRSREARGSPTRRPRGAGPERHGVAWGPERHGAAWGYDGGPREAWAYDADAEPDGRGGGAVLPLLATAASALGARGRPRSRARAIVGAERAIGMLLDASPIPFYDARTGGYTFCSLSCVFWMF